jgi:hypothetical protein
VQDPIVKIPKIEKKSIFAYWARNGRFEHFLEKNNLRPLGVKGMCKAYEKGWTYHARDIKKSQREKKKREETFTIDWLKPLQAISKIDFIFFCQKATISNAEEV